MLYLAILLMFVFFAGVAMTIGEGLWSNSILLILVMLCGVLAFVTGLPLASFVLEQAEPSEEYTWHFVMACVWGVFALSMTIMRMLLERASRVKVKFVGPLDMIAGPLMGLFVAVMFTSFVTLTLSQIPIQAGEWSTGDASQWVRDFFNYARAPFYSVLNAVTGSEGISSEIFSK